MEMFAAFQDEALLLARVFLGVMFVTHGYPKIFGEKPVLGFSNYLRKEGVPLPVMGAILASFTEFFGGLMMAAGLYVEWVAAAMAGVMLVAIAVHVKNKDDFKHGWETALLALGLALLVMTFGAGAYSLDALLSA